MLEIELPGRRNNSFLLGLLSHFLSKIQQISCQFYICKMEILFPEHIPISKYNKNDQVSYANWGIISPCYIDHIILNNKVMNKFRKKIISEQIEEKSRNSQIRWMHQKQVGNAQRTFFFMYCLNIFWVIQVKHWCCYRTLHVLLQLIEEFLCILWSQKISYTLPQIQRVCIQFYTFSPSSVDLLQLLIHKSIPHFVTSYGIQ